MFSPLMRVNASTSSLVLTVRSLKGMPRLASRVRPAPHGAQFAEVYSVTGKRPMTCPSSYGSGALPMSRDLPPRPVAVVLSSRVTGGLSENVTLPSAPTMRYTVCAWALCKVNTVVAMTASFKTTAAAAAAFSKKMGRTFMLWAPPVVSVNVSFIRQPFPDAATAHPAWARAREMP